MYLLKMHQLDLKLLNIQHTSWISIWTPAPQVLSYPRECTTIIPYRQNHLRKRGVCLLQNEFEINRLKNSLRSLTHGHRHGQQHGTDTGELEITTASHLMISSHPSTHLNSKNVSSSLCEVWGINPFNKHILATHSVVGTAKHWGRINMTCVLPSTSLIYKISEYGEGGREVIKLKRVNLVGIRWEKRWGIDQM